ncbi:MAG: ABC transporter permease [Actinomycetota bacterium]|nr:ABC transporter permease [Actinomycetota bacterium]
MDPRYLLRRLGQVPVTVAAIVVMMFVLVHLAPGDPILALAGQYGDAAYYAELRAKFGLDRPLPVQLVTYLGNVARGDLGTSFTTGRPAASLVAERLPATMLLSATALVLSSMVGVAMGTVAGRRPGRPADVTLRVGAICGYAAPSFWLAQLALISLAFGAGAFPVQGMTDARRSLTGIANLLDVVHHLALPALVLAASEVALTTRLARTGLIEAGRTEYIRAARAKGLPERRVTRHALRTALLPLVTVLGGRVGMFFAGAVLVEIVFAWPGLGRLLLGSAQTRDYPVLLAIFLVVSLGVVVVNLVTDLLYGWLDPRIRYR